MIQCKKQSERDDKMEKVAFVTGGAKGIGSAIVKRLIIDGYKVAFTYNNSEEKALKLCSEMGEDCKAYKLDITDSNAVKAVVDDIEKNFGEIQVLVNNAGIAQQALFTDITDEMWHNMIETNLSGAFYCSRAVLKYMINRKTGKIINISSIWGETGGSCEVHYSASKAGLIGYMKHCAWRLAKVHATCNSISCGGVDTALNDAVIDDDTLWNEIMKVTPLKKWATPLEIAKWIYFLTVVNESCSGQDILIDNGERDLNCTFIWPNFN